MMRYILLSGSSVYFLVRLFSSMTQIVVFQSGVQTEERQDIFVIDPSKIPNKRDFARKREYKEAINLLCL